MTTDGKREALIEEAARAMRPDLWGNVIPDSYGQVRRDQVLAYAEAANRANRPSASNRPSRIYARRGSELASRCGTRPQERSSRSSGVTVRAAFQKGENR